MTRPNTSQTTTALVGPCRYTIAINIVDDDGEETDEVVAFVVNDLALPRVGDRLHFEVSDAAISVTVSGVNHYFYPPGQAPLRREVSVDARPDPVSLKFVQRLSDPIELERWLSQLPMLEPEAV